MTWQGWWLVGTGALVIAAIAHAVATRPAPETPAQKALREVNEYYS